ncbi:MAG TPA: extracellular solute-binding protein [Bryobacteraceae bacterium]|nr:extracellular solute-binding protein [Bryobacteraceae bacterium]
MVELNGITWRHTRGYLPMVATAQRFCERNPDVTIRWQARSLQEFADSPLEQLTAQFDLLVIDHPSVGEAAGRHVLLPLDEWVPSAFLTDQARHSVGRSHESYFLDGHQWALAIDAAAPVSGYRKDLLDRTGAEIPRTWSELVALARRGLVAVPGLAIDSLMNFYMLCGTIGEEPFQSPDHVVGEDAGIRALGMMRELLQLCDPACFGRNPIATWELLSSGDGPVYCPFAYGYSNYSRRGYSNHALATGGLVPMDTGMPLRSTLGGAGLAISAKCPHKETAGRYAQYVAGADCQKGLYFYSGGQPGHRGAWLDGEVNRAANNFFENTMATLDAAYLRPRFNGYLQFQQQGARIVHGYLTAGGDERTALKDLTYALREAQRTKL